MDFIRITTRQNPKQNLFRANRLIFFADASAKKTSSESKKEKTETDRQTKLKNLENSSSMEKGTAKKMAKELARIPENERDKFEEIYEILGDPNKLAKEPYDKLPEAIAKGKFTREGDFSLNLLVQILRGLKADKSSGRYKAARDIVGTIHSRKDALSERQEKWYVDILKNMAKEEQTETETKEISEIAGKSIESYKKTKAEIDKMDEAIRKVWSPAEIPKDLLDKIEKACAEHENAYNEVEKVEDQAAAQGIKERKELKKFPPYKEARKKEIELSYKVDKLVDQLNNWQLTQWKQYSVIQELKHDSGLINLSPDTKYIRKEIKPDYKNKKLKETPWLFKYKDLKITFEPVSPEEFEQTPGTPGRMTINYTDENGDKVEDNYSNFLKQVETFETHQYIENLDELNEKSRALYYGDIKKGDTFRRIVPLDPEKDEYEIEAFTIKDIKEVQQEVLTDPNTREYKKIKNLEITISPEVIYSDTVNLPLSANAARYQTVKKSKLDGGELISLLTRHNYKKVETEEELKNLREGKIIEFNKHMEDLHPDWVDFSLEEAIETFPPEEISRFPKRPGDITEVNRIIGGEEEKVPVRNLGNGKFAVLPPKKFAPQSPLRVTKTGDNGDKYFADTTKSELLDMPTEAGVAGDSATTAGAAAPESAEAKPTAGKQFTLDDLPEPGSTLPRKKPTKSTQKDYMDNVLPFNVVDKRGGMMPAGRGFLKSLYARSKFLSIGDLWEFGKALYEFHSRRWKRQQQEKYASVGEHLPYFSPEMKRIKQSAENEEVSQFQQSIEQMGVWEIQERLRKTRNRDELKACFTVLASKGHLRWDDIKVWDVINKFVDSKYAIPIPSNGDPYTRLSATDERTGFDFLKPALDSLWGEGTYDEWYTQNKNTHLSKAKEYYEKGKELESQPGGLGGALESLLRQHKQGDYVNPQEFEGLLLFGIDYGKGTMHQKVYYMVQGVSAKNPAGRTLLSYDRMAHINGEMLPKFPLLEFMCAEVPRPPDGDARRLTKDDFEVWRNIFDEGDPMNCKPTKSTADFLWKQVLCHDATQDRINKVMRSAENLDHDDMFGYLPPASEGVITDACKATTGSKKFLTVEGYCNGFPGFSEYMRSLAESNNRTKLMEAITSYVRFEGIMLNKWDHGNQTYQRLDDTQLNTSTIVSPQSPIQFINQISDTIKKIAYAYGDPSLIRIVDQIYKYETVKHLDPKNPADKAELDRIQRALVLFGETFTKVIKSDNGEIMTTIVNGARFHGMPEYFGADETELEQRAKLKQQQYGLTY